MEWCKSEDGRYKIVSLSATIFPGALNVIRESFFPDGYVCIALEVNKNPLAIEELLELCADAALDGVSLAAVEVATDKVVSVAFNKLQVQTSSSEEKPFFEIFAKERCKQESSRELVKFMAGIDGSCNLFEKYGVDCSLEIMFLGTHRAYRRQKLGTTLSKLSMELARKLKEGPVAPMTVEDLGPKYAFIKPRKNVGYVPKICHAIFTSEGSQKVGKALNFTVHLTVPLSKFEFNGMTYSERIGNESAFCEVAAISL